MSLNKAEKLKKERRRRAENNEVLPLDPPFPYRARGFDPAFLGVGKPGKPKR